MSNYLSQHALVLCGSRYHVSCLGPVNSALLCTQPTLREAGGSSRGLRTPSKSCRVSFDVTAQAYPRTINETAMSPRGIIRTPSAPDPTTGRRRSGGRFPSILVAVVMLFNGGGGAIADFW
jgi:hypothetical protein